MNLLLAGEETELLAARLKVGNFQRCDANPDLYDSKAHAHLSIAVPLKLFHQVTPNCNGKTNTKHIPRRALGDHWGIQFKLDLSRHLGGSVKSCLSLAQVLIPGSWDGALHWAPHSAGSLLLPLPLPAAPPTCAHADK